MGRVLEVGGNNVAVTIGSNVKLVRLTWFEILGRAVLDGATNEEIRRLEADHRPARLDP